MPQIRLECVHASVGVGDRSECNGVGVLGRGLVRSVPVRPAAAASSLASGLLSPNSQWLYAACESGDSVLLFSA